MTRDEGTPEDTGGSLAEQAAAWVPPWSRPPGEEPADDDDDDDTSDTIDIAAELRAAEELRSAEEPVEQIAPEPVEEPVGEPVESAVPEALFAVDGVSDGSTVAEPPSRGSPVDDADIRTTQPAAVPTAELKGALEAILLVVDEPVGEIMLAQIVEQPTARIVAMLRELAAEYDEQERGFELRSVAGGWRFYTRTTYASYVERFVRDGQQVRLTQAALETLAVIAYKQPVTRSRISAIRGVNCDGVVRTLLGRGLIEECGSEPDSGAHLYRTTLLFLEKLGLNSVDELPPLAPFLPDDVEALADAT